MLKFVWAIVGLPFVIVGIGELFGATGMDWANWEGKVYVGFALPLLIGAVLLQLNPRITESLDLRSTEPGQEDR